MTADEPISSALRGRCGVCGEGRLFRAYLKLADQCPHCGQDFSKADTADGPAFFVGFLVLIVFAPPMFLVPMAPVAMGMKVGLLVLTMLLAVAVTLWLLPLAKAILFNLQIHHDAGQREHRSGE